jgi:hypothetical protein
MSRVLVLALLLVLPFLIVTGCAPCPSGNCPCTSNADCGGTNEIPAGGLQSGDRFCSEGTCQTMP